MLNNVQLIGNVGKDPEVRNFENNKKVASFDFATSETFKDKDGEKKTNTEWHTITAFGSSAERVEKYIKKGKLLYISGKIHYSSFDDKDGIKRKAVEIIADKIKFLDKKED